MGAAVLEKPPRFLTPGHPESMGTVELWNRTLKNTQKNNIREHENERNVHFSLYAFCILESHTVITSPPHKYIYGRRPSGPITISKEF
ncbi:hypothetical protein TNIN_380781 [Trichonephila inaurata madagascariensis]|uniref:Uncharacterized protein n=1 Tax=Trichonephila inaurata madagascariensis TaxID=2747483 RepID=A0A8X6XIQ1_9ARAC|nr:hypothetical protein TNIN_380781 [Trichonephila inaurata madagascariensis]